MSDEERVTTPFWVRVVADGRFREAVLEDPLRALASTPDIEVSSEQVRQLEELSAQERRALVTDVVRQTHVRGAVARFGTLGLDGRFGGPPDT